MAKWKCEVCGNEFENFHAQGFDNKIYCPLCYFKKENQELKLELSGYRQAILEDKDMLGLKEESEELKKQLEEFRLDIINGEPYIKLKTVTNQQQEFIEYLKHQVKLQEELNDIHLATGFEEILQKYKEIIGDNK